MPLHQQSIFGVQCLLFYSNADSYLVCRLSGKIDFCCQYFEKYFKSHLASVIWRSQLYPSWWLVYLFLWFFLGAHRVCGVLGRHCLMWFRILGFLHHEYLMTHWEALILCRERANGELSLDSFLRYLVPLPISQSVGRCWSGVFYCSWPVGKCCFLGHPGPLYGVLGGQFHSCRFKIVLRLVARDSVILPRTWAGARGQFTVLCDCDKHIRQYVTLSVGYVECNRDVVFLSSRVRHVC